MLHLSPEKHWTLLIIMVFIVRVVPGNFDICMQHKFEGSSCGNPLEEKISSFKQLCADKSWNRTEKLVFFPRSLFFSFILSNVIRIHQPYSDFSKWNRSISPFLNQIYNQLVISFLLRCWQVTLMCAVLFNYTRKVFANQLPRYIFDIVIQNWPINANEKLKFNGNFKIVAKWNGEKLSEFSSALSLQAHTNIHTH